MDFHNSSCRLPPGQVWKDEVIIKQITLQKEASQVHRSSSLQPKKPGKGRDKPGAKSSSKNPTLGESLGKGKKTHKREPNKGAKKTHSSSDNKKEDKSLGKTSHVSSSLENQLLCIIKDKALVYSSVILPSLC